MPLFVSPTLIICKKIVITHHSLQLNSLTGGMQQRMFFFLSAEGHQQKAQAEPGGVLLVREAMKPGVLP